MAIEGTINVLMSHDSSDDAKRLINLLESAAYHIYAEQIDPSTDLNALLQSRQWDLAISHLQSTALPAKALISSLRKQGLDIPTILISDNSDNVNTLEGIRMGASYVVSMDEDQYFLLATANTLEQLEHRRSLAYWRDRYRASEARCEDLIGSSKKALAIVQDGTYIYVNETYSQLFAYVEPDDMVLVPVIDTIESASQNNIKPFLKALDAVKTLSPTSVDLVCVKENGDKLETLISITQVEYQGDPALQFQIKDGVQTTAIDTKIETAHHHQAPTEISQQATLDNIGQAIRSATRHGEDSLILCLRADQDEQIRRDTSASNAEKIFTSLIKFIQEKAVAHTLCSRINQNTETLIISGRSLEEGQVFAETLCQQVAENIFEVDKQSITLSISVSIGLITQDAESPDTCLKHCLQTLDEAKSESSAPVTGPKVYIVKALNHINYTVNSDQKIAAFGQKLLEKRLIGIAFQPIVALNADESEFYEVLMRPKIEEYPENIPKDFIAKVFESPVATEIDRWVILETVKKLVAKQSAAPKTRLFLSLSAASIQDQKFTPWLKLALKTANIAPSSIIFQLRENDAGRYIEQSKTLISQLKALGSKIGLTQFGLSSNPLLIIDKLSVDYVKLDRQLIDKVKAGGEALEETQQLVMLLKDMELHCIAPFIESPTMIPTLWQSGIEYIQGHYIQAPMSEMDYDFSDEGE